MVCRLFVSLGNIEKSSCTRFSSHFGPKIHHSVIIYIRLGLILRLLTGVISKISTLFSSQALVNCTNTKIQAVAGVKICNRFI